MKNWINSSGNSSDVVLASKVALVRNIRELPFPEKLNFIEGRENGKLIYNILSKKIDDEIKLFEIWNNADEQLYNQYIEKYLITNELLNNSNKSSFILNEDETISILINEEEHIKIQCITSGLDLNDVLENAIKIDEKIEEDVDYAFDEELGYLTTKPKNAGTGMKASVIIHLPALTMSEEIKNISKDINQMGVEIRGLYVKDSKVLGNLYAISNIMSLESSEEELIDKLKKVVLDIVAEENKYREILLGKCKDELEDKIYRAYGILKSAFLLDFYETIELLSKVRFGVELALINIDKAKLNELFIFTKDFLLQDRVGRVLDTKEMKRERARIVKEILM